MVSEPPSRLTPWAEEGEGQAAVLLHLVRAAQAEPSPVVSINLGVAPDCTTDCLGSLDDSPACGSVSSSVTGAYNNS